MSFRTTGSRGVGRPLLAHRLVPPTTAFRRIPPIHRTNLEGALRVQDGRRLEREAGRNIELMWLTGRLAPDFKTIANFRRDNGPAIRAVCAQFVVLCRRMKLFTKAIVAIDGSKFKAVNNRDKNFTVAKVAKRLQQVDASIVRYLAALDRADREESDVAEAKTTRIKDKIAGLRRQMQALKAMEQQVQAAPDKQVSLTDPDARSMATSGRGTGVVGYNVQTAVDTEHHLIVAHEVTNVGHDRTQLAPMGLDIDIHVDGASGAFLAPFCAPDLVWDFRLPRVKSISTSGHKFGLAPLGAGWVIWRDAKDLPEDLIFKVNYLGGEMPTFAINFSRPAGQIVAQYYNFLRLGREGYRKVHMASYRTAQYLAVEIVRLGPFELIASGDPNESIPAVTWKIKDDVNPGYTLFDLADRLRIRGWLVPAYTLPANLADVAVQRIRQGLTRDLAALLIDDFGRAIAHLDKHPVHTPMTEAETGGFKHS